MLDNEELVAKMEGWRILGEGLLIGTSPGSSSHKIGTEVLAILAELTSVLTEWHEAEQSVRASDAANAIGGLVGASAHDLHIEMERRLAEKVVKWKNRALAAESTVIRLDGALADHKRELNGADENADEASAALSKALDENYRLRQALEAMLVVSDKGDKPKKLDEALTWRENDERAHAMARAALIRALPPTLPPAPPRQPSATAAHGVMDKDMGAI